MNTTIRGSAAGYAETTGTPQQDKPEAPKDQDVEKWKTFDSKGGKKTEDTAPEKTVVQQPEGKHAEIEKDAGIHNGMMLMARAAKNTFKDDRADGKKKRNEKRLSKEETSGYMRDHFDEAKGADDKIGLKDWKRWTRKKHKELAGDDGFIDQQEAQKDPALKVYFEVIKGRDGKVNHREFSIFASSGWESARQQDHVQTGWTYDTSDTKSTTNLDPTTGGGVSAAGDFHKRNKRARKNGEEMLRVEIQLSDGNTVEYIAPKKEMDKNPFYVEEQMQLEENLRQGMIMEMVRDQQQRSNWTEDDVHRPEDQGPANTGTDDGEPDIFGAGVGK